MVKLLGTVRIVLYETLIIWPLALHLYQKQIGSQVTTREHFRQTCSSTRIQQNKLVLALWAILSVIVLCMYQNIWIPCVSTPSHSIPPVIHCYYWGGGHYQLSMNGFDKIFAFARWPREMRTNWMQSGLRYTMRTITFFATIPHKPESP